MIKVVTVFTKQVRKWIRRTCFMTTSTMTEYVRLLVKNKKSSTERKNIKYLQEHKKRKILD